MKSWTRRQTTAYARRVLAQFPIKWGVEIWYSISVPAWVEDSNVVGAAEVLCYANRTARIWIQSRGSVTDVQETICHELLHVLFASAGIDWMNIDNKAQANLSHQIVESLAPLLVKGV